MKRPDRNYLRSIAMETMQITQQGYYQKDGQKIYLLERDYKEAVVFDRKRLLSISEDKDGRLQKLPTYDTEYILVEGDSFDSAHGMVDMGEALVMNFANALSPGGGFLNGANAQEESLCRNSTLYASLSSPEAAVMYQYNNTHKNSVDSDYMILSPSVCVFRDCDGVLRNDPFHVAVFTISAPNKKGRAKDVDQQELDDVMIARLEMMMKAAAYYQYKTLVLGAWGCGAFGHDVKRVAQYFREVLVQRGNAKFFQRIIFAILDDRYYSKIDAFADVFRDELAENIYKNNGNVMVASKEQQDKSYIELCSEMPICNHTKEVTADNIGYVQGVLYDGTPFEAEIWKDDRVGTKNLTVILPEKKEVFGMRTSQSGGQVREGKTAFEWNAALPVGMIDREIEEPPEETDFYMKYLLDNQIICLNSFGLEFLFRFLTDVQGKDLVAIDIMLERNGVVFATTDLNFRPFPAQKKVISLRVIKNEDKS